MPATYHPSSAAYFLAALVAAAAPALAGPVTNAFTYAGQLADAGTPANGAYDLRFRLYDAGSGGAQVGSVLCVDNVAVANGLFSVQLDFGAVYTGAQRFLEVDVRLDSGANCSTSVGFTTLGPRQELTASPHAAHALAAATSTTATNLNGQPASFYQNAANLTTGTISSARLTGTYSSVLTLSNAANTFTGSGAGLTALNASNLATGAVPDARLSTNVALENAANSFSADNTFLAQVGVGVANGSSVPLWVQKGEAGSNLINTNSVLVWENSTNGYMQSFSPAANEQGWLFGFAGVGGTSIAGGLIFNNSATLQGLQFRTGGNNTTMVLDSTGNLQIDGTLTTATSTRHCTVSGGAMLNVDLSNITQINFGDYYYYHADTDTTEFGIIPLRFPHGATLSKLEVVGYCPGGVGNPMRVYLIRMFWDGSVGGDELATLNVTSSSEATFTDATITNPVVDDNYAYYLHFNVPGGFAAKVHAARVTYSINSPMP